MKKSAGQHSEPQTAGNEGIGVARSLLTLANLHRDNGKAGLSEALYQQALGLMARAVGQDHPAMAEVFENYAALLRKTRRQSQAEQMEHRAEAIRAEHGRTVPVGPGS